MSQHSFSYSELVGILIDYRNRNAEEGILTPFANAPDSLFSQAAGEFFKSHVEAMQRYRNRHPTDDAFVKMFKILGYRVDTLTTAEVDELMVDHDDLYMRMTHFADSLLSSVDDKLVWHDIRAELQAGAEILVLTIGGDHRIAQYYAQQRQARSVEKGRAVSIPVIRAVEDVEDLGEAVSSFTQLVDGLFNQVDSPAVREELKAQLLAVLTQKS